MLKYINCALLQPFIYFKNPLFIWSNLVFYICRWVCSTVVCSPFGCLFCIWMKNASPNSRTKHKPSLFDAIDMYSIFQMLKWISPGWLPHFSTITLLNSKHFFRISHQTNWFDVANCIYQHILKYPQIISLQKSFFPLLNDTAEIKLRLSKFQCVHRYALWRASGCICWTHREREGFCVSERIRLSQ